MKISIVLSFLFVTFTTHVFASNEEWKDPIRSKFGIPEEIIATFKSPEDWVKFKADNIDLKSTFANLSDFKKAIDAHIQLLEKCKNERVIDCDNAYEKIKKLFGNPKDHPSSLSFEEFKDLMVKNIGIFRVSYSKERKLNDIYSLPQSIVQSENERRKIFMGAIRAQRISLFNDPDLDSHSDLFDQTKKPGKCPASLIISLSGLGNAFAKIFTHYLNNEIPRMMKMGCAGPYLSDCSEAWVTCSAAMSSVQEFCKIFEHLEHQMVIWFYNSYDSSSGITKEDYDELFSYWAQTRDGLTLHTTKSGEFTILNRDVFMLNLTTVLEELYLRGFCLGDIVPKAPGNSMAASPSWVDILSVTVAYLEKSGVGSGVYSFKHPGHIKNAMRNCMDLYFPGKIAEEIRKMKVFIGDEVVENEPIKHSDKDLQSSGFNKIRNSISVTTELCMSLVDYLKNEKITKSPALSEVLASYHENYKLFTHVLSFIKTLSDPIIKSLDADINPTGVFYLMDEDKELYFKSLDLMHTHKFVFERFMQVLKLTLKVFDN